jgi:hypothetical protein
MPLGLTDPPPTVYALLRIRIRHQPVVATSNAEGFGISGLNHPIANIELGIGAETDNTGRLGNRTPIRSVSLQRIYRKTLRNKAKLMAAAHTLTVIEMHRLATMVTGEKPHGKLSKIRPLQA